MDLVDFRTWSNGLAGRGYRVATLDRPVDLDVCGAAALQGKLRGSGLAGMSRLQGRSRVTWCDPVCGAATG